MEKKRKIEKVVWKGTFAEAEEREVEFYAQQSWKQSVETVEEMRRLYWNKEYKKGIIKKGSICKLKDDRDDF